MVGIEKQDDLMNKCQGKNTTRTMGWMMEIIRNIFTNFAIL